MLCVPSKIANRIAYVATNVPNTVCTVISMEDLAAMTGIDPFPLLSAELKSAVPDFELPHGIHYIKGRPVPVTLPDCH